MTTTRLLAVTVLAVLTAAPSFAQNGVVPSAAPRGNPFIPSVQPVDQEPIVRPAGGTAPAMPPGRPLAAAKPNVLDLLTAPAAPVAAQESDPVGTLTGQPQVAPQLPTGAYPSPYFTDGPGCCGPLGRDGRVGYEIYSYTGPTWAIGEGEFTRRLQTGWMVGGGGRSLFFDTSHTRAWVADIGLSYQYNRGEIDDPVQSFVRQQPFTNPITGQTTPRPDILTEVAVRALHRTNFNYGIGHDWWRRGPGSVGLEDCTNWRVGALLGGRWGTAHVDLEPVGVPGGYARRQNVTYGIFLAAHGTVEIPMGSWILFAGLRTEYGYDWTNLVPPMSGNMSNINILLTSGIRF